MKIISHRGYWRERGEQNSPAAFERALILGFGIETDLRDQDGAVVITHDPPAAGHRPPTLDSFLDLCHRRGSGLPLALNIKADGLQAPVAAALERAGTTSAFVFDMSVPDTLGWLRIGVPVHVRHSDVEPEPVLYAEASGIWLDQFHSDWATVEVIARHLDAGKAVCLVSPELHRRDHRAQWERLAAAGLAGHDSFSLCTDFPEQAREVFHG